MLSPPHFIPSHHVQQASLSAIHVFGMAFLWRVVSSPYALSDQNTIARMRHPALAAISAEAVQLPNWQPGEQPMGAGPGRRFCALRCFLFGGVGGVRIRIHFPKKAPLENQLYRGKLESSLLPGQREWQINRLLRQQYHLSGSPSRRDLCNMLFGGVAAGLMSLGVAVESMLKAHS